MEEVYSSSWFFLHSLTIQKEPSQNAPIAILLTESVIRGKLVWEENNCIGCHSLLGEGAYFAPELGNVFVRRGGEEGFKYFLPAWMKAQPTNIPGRRQMPQFNLTDAQLDDLTEFLKWSSKIDTNNWPPNKEG